MTQPTQLIALDIDGTLIAPGSSHDALPDADVAEIVNRLQAAGVVVVLASGRMYPGTLHVARHLGLTGPLICLQGACVHRADGSLIHSFSIDIDIANELAAYSDEHEWPFAWFDSARYLASRATEQTDQYCRVSGVVPEYRADAHLSGVVPTGIDIISTAADANGVHRQLSERYG
ncbi:MAG TPA: HAD-IIB family hydrolase, partial [Pseudomonadales bacterium]|nr:HAD-IIB family hydrolase [Pseudomonadales bacterium]